MWLPQQGKAGVNQQVVKLGRGAMESRFSVSAGFKRDAREARAVSLSSVVVTCSMYAGPQVWVLGQVRGPRGSTQHQGSTQ